MHFCQCGADEYICQQCGRIRCSKEERGEWVIVPRTGREGNVCEVCIVAATASESASINKYFKKYFKSS